MLADGRGAAHVRLDGGHVGGGGSGGWPRILLSTHAPRFTGEVAVPLAVTFSTPPGSGSRRARCRPAGHLADVPTRPTPGMP